MLSIRSKGEPIALLEAINHLVSSWKQSQKSDFCRNVAQRGAKQANSAIAGSPLLNNEIEKNVHTVLRIISTDQLSERRFVGGVLWV